MLRARRARVRRALVVAVGLAVSYTLASCAAQPTTNAAPASSDAPASTAQPTTAASASTSAPTTAPVPVPSTTAAPIVPTGCTPADAGDVQRIAAGLKRGTGIGEAFVTTIGARKWINANIYDGADKRLSSADVWIIEGNGTIYALSGGARDDTSFADGRKQPDRPSAGDDVATALQKQCVEPALQARNERF